MWLVLVALAHARCSLTRDTAGAGVSFTVTALEEPVRCRDLSLASDVDFAVRAVHRDRNGRIRRLPARQLRATADGWRIAVPALRPGEALRLDVPALPDESRLDVILGPPPPRPAARHLQWTEQHRLHPSRPASSYAREGAGGTDVRIDAQVGDTPGGPWRIDLPPSARLGSVTGARVRRGGLEAEADAERVSAHWTLPSVSSHGVRPLGPGSLELLAPGAHWVVGTSGEARVAGTPGGIRAETERGGTLRWRVDRIGDVAVAPRSAARADLSAFIRAARGRARHLGTTPEAVLRALARWHMAAIPWAAPLQPRPPRSVLRGTWHTPVEHALLLAAALDARDGAAGTGTADRQGSARWYVTGTDADAATLTGFDRVLLHVDHAGEPRWFDAACAACAPGEVATELRGRPLLDTRDRVPVGSGVLRRALRLKGDRWDVRFRAHGAAALWLREVALATDAELRSARLAQVLGVQDATIDQTTGLASPGADVEVEAHGARSPRPPAIPGEAWDGGWRDEPFDAPY
ncbi:MAG: hypothetical protein RLZZ299_3048 [Pseudomonadota bacterium]|jgi:hypothetical protein